MAIDVTVLRVFTDEDGRYGNLLGVIDAASVEPADLRGRRTKLRASYLSESNRFHGPSAP